MTKWQLTAVSVSLTLGMCVADSTSITVFQRLNRFLRHNYYMLLLYLDVAITEEPFILLQLLEV